MQDKKYQVTHERGGIISTVLTEEWLNLYKTIEQPSFIHDVNWFKAYLHSQPAIAQTCHILKVSYEGQPIAIAPLQYVATKCLGLTLRTWRIFWPGDMGINDFVIRAPSNTHDILRVLVDYLSRQQHIEPWDLLELQNIPINTGIAQVIDNYPISRQVSVYHHDSKYLTCRPDYESSIANLSGKFKKNIRRKRRKLEKAGAVTTTYYNKSNELEQAFEHFLDVEAANWKGQEGTALRNDTEQCRFYRALIDEYAESGRCVIHTLDLNGTPIAAQFALVCGETFYLLKIGYNAVYYAMGPGGLLLDETIKRFSGSPHIRRISFITGAKWNDDWVPQVHKVYHHYIYNSTIKGLICWLAEKTKLGMRTIKHKLKTK